jgi:hypothetical protein
MVGIVKSLDVALAGNNLEKMAETMDKFESQFETLDVQTVSHRASPSPLLFWLVTAKAQYHNQEVSILRACKRQGHRTHVLLLSLVITK